MKKLLLLFIMCIGLVSFAQEFKIESSKIYEKNHPNQISKVVFATPYEFYTCSYLKNVFLDNQKEITIAKYDQEFTKVGTFRFNLPKLQLRAADLDEIIELENTLIFISNSMSKKKGIREVYAQVFSKETNSVSEAVTIASYPIESYSKSGQIEVSYSANKNRIAVLANMPFVKKTKEKIMVWTFDTQLQSIWSASHTLSLDSERAYNQDLHISNDGKVYLVQRNKYNTKKATSSIITIDGDNFNEEALTEPMFFLRNTTLINIGIEDLIGGFYFEGKVPYIDNNSDKGNATTGVFLYNVNANKIIAKHEFDSSINGAKDLTSVQPIFTNVLGDDIYIIGEKQTYSSKFKSDKSTELDYLYTHGPTVLLNLDTKGTLKDTKVMNNTVTYKNENSERASMTVLPMNGGLKLLYNTSNFTMVGYFSEDEQPTYYPPENYAENGTSRLTTYLVPSSVSAVKDYNLVYFVTTNGNNIWINKMTW